MTKTITLGEGFSLPIDVITEKIAILAQSGAGKTTVGVGGFAEKLLELKQQVVVLDPKGDWWGIRSSRDGKGTGYAVTVFGGLHGDLPLYPESGATVANLIVHDGVDAVLDVSDFETDAARHRFTTEFALAFYKAKQRSKSPVLFVIEEADESCPQQMIEPTEARMVGAIKRIAKLGRFCGIGVLIISQRAADVNKKILSQASILIVMRTWHATDLKAISSALKDQVTKDVYDEVMAALPSLETGEGFVIAPKWGIKRRVKFFDRKSFDAGETPKVGAVKREPKVFAAVEIEALKASMTAEVEKAKENDPRALQARVKDLETKLHKALQQNERVTETVVEKVVEREVRFLPDSLRTAIEEVSLKLTEAVEAAEEEMAEDVSSVARSIQPVHLKPAVAVIRGTPITTGNPPRRIGTHFQPSNGKAVVDSALGGPHQRILDAVAWFEAIGIAEPEKNAIAFVAGYRPGGGAFNNPLGALRNENGKNPWPPLIYYTAGRVGLTDDGRKCANMPETPGTSDELQQRVLERLDGPGRKILLPLLGAYPKSLSKDDLAAASGYSEGGGAFNNPLGRLRSFGLIDYPQKGQVVALPVLFPK